MKLVIAPNFKMELNFVSKTRMMAVLLSGKHDIMCF